jgi:hypothetical protein
VDSGDSAGKGKEQFALSGLGKRLLAAAKVGHSASKRCLALTRRNNVKSNEEKGFGGLYLPAEYGHFEFWRLDVMNATQLVVVRLSSGEAISVTNAEMKAANRAASPVLRSVGRVTCELRPGRNGN